MLVRTHFQSGPTDIRPHCDDAHLDEIIEKYVVEAFEAYLTSDECPPFLLTFDDDEITLEVDFGGTEAVFKADIDQLIESHLYGRPPEEAVAFATVLEGLAKSLRDTAKGQQ